MAQGEVRFDGRAIVVTGAGRGIGRAHALLLASRGAMVVVADNGTDMEGDDPSPEPANSVVAEITAAQGKAVAYTEDLGTEAGSTGAVAACLDAFGRIDGIVHNASTVPNLVKVTELSSHDMDVVMRVNTYAAMWMSRAAWPHMQKQKYGRIVYTTSGAIYGADGNGPYAAAKTGNIGMMRCLAAEGTKDGILVNIYSPSAATRMTDFHPGPFKDWHLKTMKPERVAVGVAYLVSEDCKITGEMFCIGGGRLARITLAETEGYFGEAASIEEMRDAMPQVMAETSYAYPKDLTERSARVSKLFGFEGGSLKATDGFAVKVREKKQR
jgi:NAD(P)-dependent dehydrogenase (short-subunit alcohol dehydrogenase family)